MSFKLAERDRDRERGALFQILQGKRKKIVSINTLNTINIFKVSTSENSKQQKFFWNFEVIIHVLNFYKGAFQFAVHIKPLQRLKNTVF